MGGEQHAPVTRLPGNDLDCGTTTRAEILLRQMARRGAQAGATCNVDRGGLLETTLILRALSAVLDEVPDGRRAAAKVRHASLALERAGDLPAMSHLDEEWERRLRRLLMPGTQRWQ